MSWNKLTPLFLAVATLAYADPDPATFQKQTQDLERRERREQQKVDQAEEQDRIKLRTRERDELARVQRESAQLAINATATALTSGTMATIDTNKLAEAKFNEDEF